MQIVKNAIILKLKNPSRVLNIIPTAKFLKFNNHVFVAIPYKLEETRILNNLGFSVPSPIEQYYSWPGQNSPFTVQRKTAAFLTLYNRAYCLNDIGTGKTRAALWAFDYLKSIGKHKRALVVAPLSTLECTWANEIFFNFTYLSYAVLYGTRQQRLKLLEQQVDIYIINHDGLSIIAESLADRPDISLVIIDELTQAARNKQTKRWKLLNMIINKQFQRAAWGLSGTPIPNAPTDAWAQCKLLTPHSTTKYFHQFRDLTMRQVSTFKWIPRPEAVKIVHNSMQPAVRFTRDECVDLPPCMYETRKVELTETQKKAYKEMFTKLVIEIESGQVAATNEAAKIQKLLQIACGVAYDINGEEQIFDPGPRLQEVLNIIEECIYKLIIFAPFVSVVKMIYRFLKKKNIDCELVYGDIDKNKRTQIFTEFQNSNTLRVLVAQPAAMSHGLTLTAANVIVWYAPVINNETFEQANGRIIRPGQKNKQLIIMLEGTDIEREFYKRLKEKQKIQGVLLDLVQKQKQAA